jgi:hypothetical protein
MHLFGSNLGPQIALMMTTDNFTKNHNPLRLENGQIQKVNTLLRSSCQLTPTTFSGVIEKIDSGYKKSVDWIHFIRYVLPTTLLSFYDDTDTREALLCFSKICIIAFQREIRKNDAIKMRIYINKWMSWLNALVKNNSLQTWVFSANMHMLLHLPDLVLFLGPLRQ